MTGKLYGIGVGPGDPELLTLKAKRILESSEVIAIPVKVLGEHSVAMDIIEQVVDVSGKKVIEVLFSMNPDDDVRVQCRAEAGKLLTDELEKGRNIAMITIGDVSVYSTYMYINQFIEESGFETEIIPGIPSFCSGAALAKIPLMEGRESLVVIPSTQDGNLLSNALGMFENVVVMKVGGSSMQKLADAMSEKGIDISKATVLSRIGLEGEYIGPIDLSKDYNYLTTVIIKKNED